MIRPMGKLIQFPTKIQRDVREFSRRLALCLAAAQGLSPAQLFTAQKKKARLRRYGLSDLPEEWQMLDGGLTKDGRT